MADEQPENNGIVDENKTSEETETSSVPQDLIEALRETIIKEVKSVLAKEVSEQLRQMPVDFNRQCTSASLIPKPPVKRCLTVDSSDSISVSADKYRLTGEDEFAPPCKVPGFVNSELSSSQSVPGALSPEMGPRNGSSTHSSAHSDAMSDLFPNKPAVVQQGQDLNLIEDVLAQVDEEQPTSEDLGPEIQDALAKRVINH